MVPGVNPICIHKIITQRPQQRVRNSSIKIGFYNFHKAFHFHVTKLPLSSPFLSSSATRSPWILAVSPALCLQTRPTGNGCWISSRRGRSAGSTARRRAAPRSSSIFLPQTWNLSAVLALPPTRNASFTMGCCAVICICILRMHRRAARCPGFRPHPPGKVKDL